MPNRENIPSIITGVFDTWMRRASREAILSDGPTGKSVAASSSSVFLLAAAVATVAEDSGENAKSRRDEVPNGSSAGAEKMSETGDTSKLPVSFSARLVHRRIRWSGILRRALSVEATLKHANTRLSHAWRKPCDVADAGKDAPREGISRSKAQHRIDGRTRLFGIPAIRAPEGASGSPASEMPPQASQNLPGQLKTHAVGKNFAGKMLRNNTAQSNSQLRDKDAFVQLPTDKVLDATCQGIGKLAQRSLRDGCLRRCIAQSVNHGGAHVVKQGNVLLTAKRQGSRSRTASAFVFFLRCRVTGSRTMGPVPNKTAAAKHQHLHSQTQTAIIVFGLRVSRQGSVGKARLERSGTASIASGNRKQS
eukprot:scaffold7832_cov267-Pinguiococcus_pyrenoidosus.AAC.4